MPSDLDTVCKALFDQYVTNMIFNRTCTNAEERCDLFIAKPASDIARHAIFSFRQLSVIEGFTDISLGASSFAGIALA